MLPFFNSLNQFIGGFADFRMGYFFADQPVGHHG